MIYGYMAVETYANFVNEVVGRTLKLGADAVGQLEEYVYLRVYYVVQGIRRRRLHDNQDPE